MPKRKNYVFCFMVLLFPIYIFSGLNLLLSEGYPRGSFNDKSKLHLKTSNFWDLDGGIIIDNNWSDTRDNYDWCSGNGTEAQPYIIENVTINANYIGGVLEIRNTNEYFIIRNSTFVNSGPSYYHEGISLHSVSNGLITDSFFFNISGITILLESATAVSVLNNEIDTSNKYGIHLYDNSYNNFIINNSIILWTAGGIYVGQSENNIFEGNIIYTSGYAINLWTQSNNNTIEKNTLSYGDLIIQDSDFNYVKNNDILVGRLTLERSSNNKIINNWIKDDNSFCVDLDQNSSLNYFSDNVIESTRTAILVRENSNNNTFTSNILRDNMYYGIEIEQTASNNLVINNTFENNDIFNAIDNGQDTKWNDTILGNFWDDYSGKDANDDGLGDTPYFNIGGSAGSKDNLPIWWDAPFFLITSPKTNESFDASPIYNIAIDGGIADTMWYSLDNSITNITFTNLTGNFNETEWENKPEGPLKIIFYANDSKGYVGKTEVQIIKDMSVPNITIVSPTSNQEFGSKPPDFSITINDFSPMNAIWYTIDGGLTNYTFSGTTGTIDQDAWNTVLEGNITITFYAQDGAGYIGTQTVIVIKRIPPQPSIPGYNIYIFSGVVFIGLIITLQKKHKS